MKYRFASIIALSVMLVGAGCNPSLQERVAQYQTERDECIESRRQAYDATYDEVPGTWDTWQENRAEYACSTVELAKKYYAQDPEGIIELCVRTELISGDTYTYRNVTIEKDSLEDQKRLCEIAINNVLGSE